jgi:hypothetical protein
MAALAGFLALGTAAAGVFTELASSGYARQAISLVSGEAGTSGNAVPIKFPAAAGLLPYSAMAIFSASSGGSPLFWWEDKSPDGFQAPDGKWTIPIGGARVRFPAATAADGSPLYQSQPYLWTPDGLSGASSGAVGLTANLPASLSWDQTNYPLSLSLLNKPGRKSGTASLDPDNMAEFAACFAATPIYVNGNTGSVTVSGVTYPAGNDSTGDGTAGAPYKTLGKAQTVANAAGTAAYIKVVAGTYDYVGGFSNSGAPVTPTVKTVYEAIGGRVISSTRQSMTWAADATNTATQKAQSAFAFVPTRVFDLSARDSYGGYRELVSVSSAAICNATPGTYYSDGTVSNLYVHRHDGEACTNTNTMVLVRCGNFRATATAPKSVYLRGLTDADGFDLEGGNTGAFRIVANSGLNWTAPIVAAARNCTFRYATYTGLAGHNVAIDNIYGLSVFINCDASFAVADGFNFHNTNNSAGTAQLNSVSQVLPSYALTVNCSAHDCGRGSSTSNNGLTAHENYTLVDLGGWYEGNRGGNVHIINSAKALLAGTLVRNSLGDKMNGGSFDSFELRAADTSTMWLDSVEIAPASAGRMAFYVSETAAIYYRNMWPVIGAQAKGTASTLAAY